ncbi:TPA: glucosaminidase domain-containing protein [Staphylococcus aureus]|uniref:glucosaminidase domain-containing protein n=1 Tax=Staphylococcus aureus TaxID=1280 RepID=UPI000768F8A1|nr:glucosaminidase domain-containing protein [Staphylococcus aureus]CAC9429118.1 mannosyl-glycoprotein endo-beta-N-acetylglucosaminidase [Staphylococcus aureus]CYB86664.1 mannosyl-glycoprotein endo-beta-N-acetylglucosaminidase [Staphylococcus aureus]HAR4432693.1 CHAP domain-containing protein [Staphylococcus aureus]HCY7006729.1 glucosaminidase domain-containing protein [Staphylococcus aureus]HCY7055968.1 glucosaminidase domain-containing protein [Staphylococcus aureus]
MGLPNPKTRKPTASEVVEWAKSNIGKRINIDNYRGSQCWDTPNFIFKRYWGFVTWGNAKDMANYRYPKGFRFYRYSSGFVPEPGDIAIWHPGNGIGSDGHTAIVVGPSNKSYFYSVDQNWVNSNSWTGSPGRLVRHPYVSVTGFVRPPYSKDTSKPSSTDTSSASKANDSTITGEAKKPQFKEVKTVKYTAYSNVLDKEEHFIDHIVVMGDERSDIQGLYIKESMHMRSVDELYTQRNKFISDYEIPHLYVDREATWLARPTNFDDPRHPNWLVIEVCGGQTDSKRQFLMNQIQALIRGVWLLSGTDKELSETTLKVDPNIWRSMKDLINYDLIKQGIPDDAKYEQVKKKMLETYIKRDILTRENIKEVTTKTTIRISDKTSVDSASTRGPTASDEKPSIVTEKSSFTFQQALDRQMSRGNPKKSHTWGWANATRAQTSSAMNVKRIWESNTQCYQMLNLGKYQGVSVSALNKILKGKGTLDGQGKAFAEACKKNNINEIYLIAHAFLESGYGTSNFASGRYGAYNYFGIGAFDNDPDYAMKFAKNKGWTTPAKAIMGGASFVRKDYINKGQNTLYRIRWNPKNPATHQYATAIEWCQHQASTIAKLYKQIGLKGIYFIRDKYK